jgi:hypothetical protein
MTPSQQDDAFLMDNWMGVQVIQDIMKSPKTVAMQLQKTMIFHVCIATACIAGAGIMLSQTMKYLVSPDAEVAAKGVNMCEFKKKVSWGIGLDAAPSGLPRKSFDEIYSFGVSGSGSGSGSWSGGDAVNGSGSEEMAAPTDMSFLPVLGYGARFSTEIYTRGDVIGSHACSLEDLACV